MLWAGWAAFGPVLGGVALIGKTVWNKSGCSLPVFDSVGAGGDILNEASFGACRVLS